MEDLVWIISLCYLGVSQGQLTVEGPAVSVPGGNIIYFCLSSSRVPIVSGIQWLVNETVQNTETSVLLELTNLTLEYNGSCIRCKMNTLMSNCRLLLLQGLLSAVGSIVLIEDNYDVSLNWTAPFSLDITGVSPDITYCVDVVYSMHSDSKCGINITQFIFPSSPISGCDQLTFIITPVNIVGNGTSSSLNYTLYQLPVLVELMMMSANCTADHAQSTTYLLVMTAPVCRSELTFVDIDTGETITLEDNDLIVEGTNITFTTQQLLKNRRYDIAIMASNVAGSASSQTVLSTHDIRSLQVTLQEMDGRRSALIAVSYTEYSCATGALIILFAHGSMNFTFLALDRATSLALPFELSTGQYRVLVYDIESDGALNSGVNYPAVRLDLATCDAIHGEHIEPASLLERCHITTSGAIISVMCSYHSNSTTTGFQMMATQLSSFNTVHKLYVNKTTTHQTLTSVVVEESGLYHITIFAISGERGIVNSDAQFMERIMVSLPDTATATTITATTTNDVYFTTTLGMGVGLGIFTLLSLVLCVMLLMTVIQNFKLRSRYKQKETSIQLDEEVGEGAQSDKGETQMYEITDTRDIVTEVDPPPQVQALSMIPQYEDVLLEEKITDYNTVADNPSTSQQKAGATSVDENLQNNVGHAKHLP